MCFELPEFPGTMVEPGKRGRPNTDVVWRFHDHMWGIHGSAWISRKAWDAALARFVGAKAGSSWLREITYRGESGELGFAYWTVSPGKGKPGGGRLSGTVQLEPIDVCVCRCGHEHKWRPTAVRKRLAERTGRPPPLGNADALLKAIQDDPPSLPKMGSADGLATESERGGDRKVGETEEEGRQAPLGQATVHVV